MLESRAGESGYAHLGYLDLDIAQAPLPLGAMCIGAKPLHSRRVPTKTCCAVGPAWVDEVDAITGGLSLL